MEDATEMSLFINPWQSFTWGDTVWELQVTLLHKGITSTKYKACRQSYQCIRWKITFFPCLQMRNPEQVTDDWQVGSWSIYFSSHPTLLQQQTALKYLQWSPEDFQKKATAKRTNNKKNHQIKIPRICVVWIEYARTVKLIYCHSKHFKYHERKNTILSSPLQASFQSRDASLAIPTCARVARLF